MGEGLGEGLGEGVRVQVRVTIRVVVVVVVLEVEVEVEVEVRVRARGTLHSVSGHSSVAHCVAHQWSVAWMWMALHVLGSAERWSRLALVGRSGVGFESSKCGRPSG